MLGFCVGLCACSVSELGPPSREGTRERTPPKPVVASIASTPDVQPAASAVRNLEVAEPAKAPAGPRHRPETPLLDADIDWDANAVMRVLGKIAQTMNHSRYSAITRVSEQQGSYEFDCSGMTQWVLKKAAPIAARAAAWKLKRRPLAADFYRRIASVPVGEARHGWRRVQSITDAQPGDVIAWLKPKIIRSPYTGHVAFIALPPVKVTGYSDAYLVRVIDSTSLLHDEDTRVGRSGFGMGTILVVVDPSSGVPRAYGWAGLKWRGFEAKMALGRPVN